MNTFTRLLMATRLIFAAPAASNTGHDAGAGFTGGLVHPKRGLDCLLAMTAIRFWSMRQSATLKKSKPLFVIGGMILGAVFAQGG
ncbi:HupE/UreJ family protein [Marinobacter sp. ATCH36]|uniref:HupE/UreJ family protein n=1 Tax=Marinobacter sp. ATCH36 TaxID=2945106 RepID=UPI0024C25767|nr:HupE/UreJ family protein [Marinobacter sp. ATCH36]